MRLGIVASRSAAHQISTAEALKKGLAEHGDTATIFQCSEDLDRSGEKFDALCFWGWRKAERYCRGYNVLVMERAYLADRFHWVSLGWNGLNGRATWPQQRSISRWEQHFAHLMQQWKCKEDGYALILGQVPTDTAVRHIGFIRWASRTAELLRDYGYPVRFRAHPKSMSAVPGNVTDVSATTLENDLNGARFTVSLNSNSGVDSVLAGVPLVACDIGSMAWDIASHEFRTPQLMPDRTEWAARLAWKQWLPYEIADGSAWEIVKAALPQVEAV